MSRRLCRRLIDSGRAQARAEAHPFQVPALRLGQAALGGDPRIPVRERHGGGVVRKLAGERLVPVRLAEQAVGVAVDRETAASHGAAGRQAPVS